jgi:hypothetical protein
MILDELHSPIMYCTTVGWEYPSSDINLSDTHVFRLSSLAIFTATNKINQPNLDLEVREHNKSGSDHDVKNCLSAQKELNQ